MAQKSYDLSALAADPENQTEFNKVIKAIEDLKGEEKEKLTGDVLKILVEAGNVSSALELARAAGTDYGLPFAAYTPLFPVLLHFARAGADRTLYRALFELFPEVLPFAFEADDFMCLGEKNHTSDEIFAREDELMNADNWLASDYEHKLMAMCATEPFGAMEYEKKMVTAEVAVRCAKSADNVEAAVLMEAVNEALNALTEAEKKLSPYFGTKLTVLENLGRQADIPERIALLESAIERTPDEISLRQDLLKLRQQIAHEETVERERLGAQGKFIVDGFWKEEPAEQTQPGITAAAFYTEAARLGVALPVAYFNVLELSNGGTPVRRAHKAPFNSWARHYVLVNRFLPLDAARMLEEKTRLGLPDGLIPFATQVNNDNAVFCFDYRSNEVEPSIAYSDPDPDIGIFTLAPDMLSFLVGLTDEVEYEVGFEELNQTLSYFTATLNAPLKPELLRAVSETLDPVVTNHFLRQRLFALVKANNALVLEKNRYTDRFLFALFWLVSLKTPVADAAQFGQEVQRLAVSDSAVKPGFGLLSYSPAFIDSWVGEKLESGELVQKEGKLALSVKVLDAIEAMQADIVRTLDPDPLERFHNMLGSNHFREVVEGVRMLPPDDRTPELMMQVVCAYNNLSEFDSALVIIDQLKELVSDEDPYMHYLESYALFNQAVEKMQEGEDFPVRLQMEKAFQAITMAQALVSRKHEMADMIREFRDYVQSALVNFDQFKADMMQEHEIEAAADIPALGEYTQEQGLTVIEHVSRYFGEPDDLVRLSFGGEQPFPCAFAVLKPLSFRPEKTVVTLGLGSYPMTIGQSELPQAKPEDIEGLRRCELMISMPSDWRYDDPSATLPYIILQLVASNMKDDWIGFGHVLEWGEGTGPFTGALILMPQGPSRLEKDMRLRESVLLDGDRKVNFYHVIPLLPEEIRFAQNHSPQQLIERLGHLKYVVDTGRKSPLREK